MANIVKHIGIVVECYNPDPSHQVIVVRSQKAKNHFFFYAHRTPAVGFGDKIQMNFQEDKFYVRRGNSKLTYKITPLTFPGTLLLELLSERLSL